MVVGVLRLKRNEGQQAPGRKTNSAQRVGKENREEDKKSRQMRFAMKRHLLCIGSREPSKGLAAGSCAHAGRGKESSSQISGVGQQMEFVCCVVTGRREERVEVGVAGSRSPALFQRRLRALQLATAGHTRPRPRDTLQGIQELSVVSDDRYIRIHTVALNLNFGLPLVSHNLFRHLIHRIVTYFDP